MLDALHGLMNWTPLGLPAFLFVITVVVFFHEMGHFLVGRFFGVTVEVFSVGFGRELVGFTDRHGTRWRLSMLPIGGYVRFAGDADAASRPDAKAGSRMSAEQKSGALMFKPLPQRAAVAAAGPVANFILAIVMLTGLLLYSGHTTILPVAGAITRGGPADLAGIRTGDRITRIGIVDITDFRQVQTIVSGSNGTALDVGLNRAGRDLTVSVTPRKTEIKDDAGKTLKLMLIGINRDARSVVREHYSPIGAFAAACSETWNIARTTIVGIGQMISGHGGADQLSGPVGIAQITKQVADYGIVPLLNLVAFLSVSIGLANLFPIPLLDGGHLLYYAVEAVLGRPLGVRAQDVGFRLGLVLVLGLMLLTTWNDLVRLNLF